MSNLFDASEATEVIDLGDVRVVGCVHGHWNIYRACDGAFLGGGYGDRGSAISDGIVHAQRIEKLAAKLREALAEKTILTGTQAATGEKYPRCPHCHEVLATENEDYTSVGYSPVGSHAAHERRVCLNCQGESNAVFRLTSIAALTPHPLCKSS